MKIKLKWLTNLIIPMAFMLLIAAGIYIAGSAAADGPDWLNMAASPTIVKQFSYAAGSYNSVITDNGGCEKKTIRL